MKKEEVQQFLDLVTEQALRFVSNQPNSNLKVTGIQYAKAVDYLINSQTELEELREKCQHKDKPLKKN